MKNQSKTINFFLIILIIILSILLIFTRNKKEYFYSNKLPLVVDVDNKYDKKLIKKNTTCFIFYNHVRDINNKIFIDSIIRDYGGMYINLNIYQSNSDLKKIVLLQKNFKNDRNKNLYLGKRHTLRGLDFFNLNITKIKKIKKNVFCFFYDTFAWAHKILYGYIYLYYYINLQKLHDKLYLLTTKQIAQEYRFVFEILNIKNIIYIEKNEKIINSGITYFLYTNSRLSPQIIDFFHKKIAKISLKKFVIKPTKIYPKKLLFIRNKNNISKNAGKRLLRNREEIVKLCSKYGYTDIDQTKYNDEEVIYLLNNATHIILESGGSVLHLVWAKNIKSIILVWSYITSNVYTNSLINVNKNTKYLTTNGLSDISNYKKSKIILNNDKHLHNFIYRGIKPPNIQKNSNFNNLNDLKNAIIENN
jgi:hypothetical protein